MTVAHERVAPTKLLGVAFVRAKEVDELPDIETAPDDPGPPGPAAVADPWEEAHLRGLLRQFLDDRAPRTADATSLLSHEHVCRRPEPNGEGLCLGSLPSTHRYTVVSVAQNLSHFKVHLCLAGYRGCGGPRRPCYSQR